ncbi:MAG: BatA domain-containing protein, partial [Longimicrobiales bacterium]
MGLLAPAFLIGLAALAVPVLIHLIRRERHDAV